MPNHLNPIDQSKCRPKVALFNRRQTPSSRIGQLIIVPPLEIESVCQQTDIGCLAWFARIKARVEMKAPDVGQNVTGMQAVTLVTLFPSEECHRYVFW